MDSIVVNMFIKLLVVFLYDWFIENWIRFCVHIHGIVAGYATARAD